MAGFSSTGEPPRCRARLLPTSPLVARPGWRAPPSGVPSRGTPLMPSAAAIEVLWKEREDTIGAAEDACREVEEEQVAAAVTENMRDAV